MKIPSGLISTSGTKVKITEAGVRFAHRRDPDGSLSILREATEQSKDGSEKWRSLLLVAYLYAMLTGDAEIQRVVKEANRAIMASLSS